MTEVSECLLTSLSESSGPLKIKPASLWGLQPNLCLSLSKILCKGHSCRDIPRVCPERYRDTFIKFLKKTYLSFMWSISLVPYWGSGWPSCPQAAAFLDSAPTHLGLPSHSWATEVTALKTHPSPSCVSHPPSLHPGCASLGQATPPASCLYLTPIWVKKPRCGPCY